MFISFAISYFHVESIHLRPYPLQGANPTNKNVLFSNDSSAGESCKHHENYCRIRSTYVRKLVCILISGQLKYVKRLRWATWGACYNLRILSVMFSHSFFLSDRDRNAVASSLRCSQVEIISLFCGVTSRNSKKERKRQGLKTRI